MSLSKEQLSDYQVCHVIGSGSFGTCYKVRHKNTNKFYVWKVIDYGDMSEDKKKLLVSEVNVLSELNSCYIVKYHNRIIDSDITTLYIIMEYCPGGDLASLIKKYKRTEQFLEEKFIWKVLYQLSIALHVCHSTLHQCQVLHRDIKPANVFLDEDNNIKLGDFGLARVLNWDESHSNTIVGTPYYMSPEVIQGGKYNLKSDIWALGCLIYELCMFKPPFHGDNIRELSQQITDNGFPRIPAHYSNDLHQIILYMLSKNNELRPNIETLLQHPLMVKHTSSYRDSLDPVYMKPRDIQRIIYETNNATNPLYMTHKDVQRTIIDETKSCKYASGVPSTNVKTHNYQNVPHKNVVKKNEMKNISTKNENQISNPSDTHKDKIGVECGISDTSDIPSLVPSINIANHKDRNIPYQVKDKMIKPHNNVYQNVPTNKKRADVTEPQNKTRDGANVLQKRDGNEVGINKNHKVDDVSNNKDYNVIKLDETRSNSYDEIYGTCVDLKTPPLDYSNKNRRQSVSDHIPEIPQKMVLLEPACYQYNYVNNEDINGAEHTFAELKSERLTKPHKIQFKNSSFETQIKAFEATEKGDQENEEKVDLAQVQMNLIRQIFNSKMHMKDIMQCFSSDENIYMNSKSLLNRHQGSDKNNNRPDESQDGGSNGDNVLKENESIAPMENNNVRAYLETAIDDSFGNKNLAVKSLIKHEETDNSTDEKYVKISLDQSDKDQIMERYQTLEDKINGLLAIQNNNEEIKFNNSNDLETLLKEKLDKIRQHEAYIKHKEKQLETLEKSLNRRERCLALQERLAQEKIQRAQVYLKQCKESRKNLGLRSATMSELKSSEQSTVSNTPQNITKTNSKIQNMDIGTEVVDAKSSRKCFSTQRSKVTLVPQVKRLLPVDNDSSLSADPGDTSILPTMSKIDPVKVKPLRYYRHVHFEDQFRDKFDEMNGIGMKTNDIQEPERNSLAENHIGFRTEYRRFSKASGNDQFVQNNKLNVTRGNRSLQAIRMESNQQAMPTKSSEGLNTATNKVHSQNYPTGKGMNINLHPMPTKSSEGLNTATNKVHSQNYPTGKGMNINLHPITSTSKKNHNQTTSIPHNTSIIRPNTNLATAVHHKSKLSCLANHQISQRQSLTNIKLRQFVEARTPLSNVFNANNGDNRVISKRHSSPSALVSPGFITSTLNTNIVQKDEQVKSVTLLPTGDANSQNRQTETTETNLTGMKKHFVKSKTTQMSNSNIQQCIRRSVRSKENFANTQKGVNDDVGKGKENTPVETESHPSGKQHHDFNMKQLDQNNIELIRKQLQPFSSQNQYVRPKFHFRDILKTRYDNLKLSPLTDNIMCPSK